jgi:flavodoxin
LDIRYWYLLVVYFSRTGNTKKVAEAIAEELKVEAKDVKAAGILPKDAFLFLGTGCYGATLPKEIDAFMKKNNFRGRIIALFTTSAFGSVAERNLIEKQLTDKGAIITHNFKCFGHFLTMKKEHPTLQELEKAKEFARTVAVTMFPDKVEREKTLASKR